MYHLSFYYPIINENECITCPSIIQSSMKSSSSNFQVNLNKPVNCNSCNVVCCIICDKPTCKRIQYLGETGPKFKIRFAEHLNYVRSNIVEQPTGNHFNLPGHSVSNMTTLIIEKCSENSTRKRTIFLLTNLIPNIKALIVIFKLSTNLQYIKFCTIIIFC